MLTKHVKIKDSKKIIPEKEIKQHTSCRLSTSSLLAENTGSSCGFRCCGERFPGDAFPSLPGSVVSPTAETPSRSISSII